MQALLVGFVGLAYSAALMFYVAILIAMVASDGARERFWIAIVSVALQLGTVSTLASLITQLTPLEWILIQSGLSLLALAVLRTTSGRSLPRLATTGFARSEAAADSGRSIFAPFASRWGKVWLNCILGLLVLSCVRQAIQPIVGFDDRMYRASRVVYWIQHQSTFPYVTHNDRQVMYSYGSELFFLWPLLFTKCEFVARMVFWLGFPCSAIGLYTLARELQLSKAIAAAAAAAFVATPIVLRLSVGMSPALWLTVFVLGAAFWTVRAARQPSYAGKYCFLAALNAVVAVGVKFTAIPLVPIVIVLPLFMGVKSRFAAVGFAVAGAIAGLFASSLMVSIASNELEFGHPLGAAEMRHASMADVSLREVYTHTVRLQFLLLEAPLFPSAAARQQIARFGNRLIAAVGADRPLPMESPTGWPGQFTFDVPAHGTRFSWMGALWLPALAVALVLFLRDLRRTFPRIVLSPVSLLLLLDFPLLAGIVYLGRWQPVAGVPDRFLVPAFALAIAIGAAVVGYAACRKQALATVAGILVFVVVGVAIVAECGGVIRSCGRTYPERVDEPFAAALSHIPSGSSILLIGDQDVRDYPLFDPRHAYSNRVTSWGKSRFDPGRMQALIQNEHITHILIQDGREVHPCAAGVRTVEMVQWLRGRSNLTEIPLTAPEMHLFALAD